MKEFFVIIVHPPEVFKVECSPVAGFKTPDTFTCSESRVPSPSPSPLLKPEFSSSFETPSPSLSATELIRV